MQKVFILNGWSASPEAWQLCTFKYDRLFSYVDIMEGLPREMIKQCDKAVLVGWSMGGCHALELASEFPAKVAGLVLVAATARMMEDKASGWIGMSPRRIEALERGTKLTHGAGFFGFPEGKPNPYAEDTDENLSRGISYLRNTDVRERITNAAKHLSCPIHIFHSEKDGVVRPANAAFLKSIFPDAHVTMIPGAEHALSIFIPELIDAAVSNIVQSPIYGL